MVVGDGHGVVGFGIARAGEVPSAIKKAHRGPPRRTSCARAAAGLDHSACGGRQLYAGSVLLKPVPDGTASSPVARCARLSKPRHRQIPTKPLGSATRTTWCARPCPDLDALKDPGPSRACAGKELSDLAGASA